MTVMNAVVFAILCGIIIVQSIPPERSRGMSTRSNSNMKKRTGNSLNSQIQPISNRHRRYALAQGGKYFDQSGHAYMGNPDFVYADESNQPFISPYPSNVHLPQRYNYNYQNDNKERERENLKYDNDRIVYPEEAPYEIDWSKVYITSPNQNSVIDQSWQINNINNNNNNNVKQNTNSNTNTPYERPGRLNPCEVNCHRHVTNEYNPICGSNNITYKNPSSFQCALDCGRQITGKRDKNCGSGIPIV